MGMIRGFSQFALAVSLAACAHHIDPAAGGSHNAGDAIASTERAFSAKFQETGFESFVEFAADDAVVPGETGYDNAKQALAALLARPRPEGFVPAKMMWWPERVEASCAGDIGFSTGPVVRDRKGTITHATYFSIWQRQEDGQYRWIFDRGVDHQAPQAGHPMGAPAVSGSHAYCGGSAGDLTARKASFLAAEAAFKASLLSDPAAAYAQALADDARVGREGSQPASGRAAASALGGAAAAGLRHSESANGISQSGDLAYSYGVVLDAKNEQKGGYVRIWRNRGDGWQLLYDQVNQRGS